MSRRFAPLLVTFAALTTACADDGDATVQGTESEGASSSGPTSQTTASTLTQGQPDTGMADDDDTMDPPADSTSGGEEGSTSSSSEGGGEASSGSSSGAESSSSEGGGQASSGSSSSSSDGGAQTSSGEGSSESSSSSDGGGESSSSTGDPAEPCVEVEAGVAVGLVATGSTVGEDDDVAQGCALNGGPDSMVEWTAPADGFYVFDTIGSGYDTALSLYTECEGGSELECNDDAAGNLLSRIVEWVDAGTTLAIAVSGFNGATGDWQLNISTIDVACNETDIGSATGPGVAAGNTALTDDDLAQSCAGGGGADAVVLWTPPDNGLYYVDTIDSLYDTSLAVYTECDAGSEIACDDDSAGIGGASRVLVDANEGIPLLLSVSGFGGGTGFWQLNIDPIDTSCTFFGIPETTGYGVVAGNSNIGSEVLEQSCAAGGAVDVAVYWTAPTTGFWEIDTGGSLYDTALSVHSECGAGTELFCDDDGGSTSQSALTIGAVQGTVYVIAVSGFGGATGPFVLNIHPPQDHTCFESQMGSATGVAAAGGSTTATDEDFTLSCGAPGAVDSVVWWTAPATGSWQITTLGSSFDTLLAVFDECDAATELACDDDGAGGLLSSVVIDALAGESFMIVVSGFGGATGDWSIDINPA